MGLLPSYMYYTGSVFVLPIIVLNPKTDPKLAYCAIMAISHRA